MKTIYVFIMKFKCRIINEKKEQRKLFTILFVLNVSLSFDSYNYAKIMKHIKVFILFCRIYSFPLYIVNSFDRDIHLMKMCMRIYFIQILFQISIV